MLNEFSTSACSICKLVVNVKSILEQSEKHIPVVTQVGELGRSHLPVAIRVLPHPHARVWRASTAWPRAVVWMLWIMRIPCAQ